MIFTYLDRLYALLWDSSIVVISTTTNPCHLIEEWGNSCTYKYN